MSQIRTSKLTPRHTKPAPSVYRKSNSFVEISGIEGAADLVARIQKIRDGLTDAPAKQRAILERACADLLAASDIEPAFRLQPFIAEEMRRLRDDELTRFLFYRYRYDVFPETRELDDFPPCVQIEPSSICNYRCVFCYQTDKLLTQGRHGHMGMMSLDTFKNVVDQIEGEVEAVTLASRGEPLMAKQIESMLDYAAGKFLGLKINTNASYLNEKMSHAILSAEPNTLVFSADAADAQLYSELRVNGALDKVLANIRQFVDIKHKHYPGSRTITRVSGVKYSDRQEFSAIESFWHDYVDQVAFVDYNPWENPYDEPANGMTTPCSDLWRRAFVWWDGKVNPCDVDYRSTLSTGNILQKPLSEIWRGDGYERLRRAHIDNDRQSLTPCKSCVVV